MDHRRIPSEPGETTGAGEAAPSGSASPAPVRTAFDVAYEGTPTWDIGRPQGALVRLASAGEIAGSVIDLGCGTGENAIFVAGLGFDVLGIDFAAAAIARARHEAAERGSAARFELRDVRSLAAVARSFDTALDVGCFHTLQPAEQRRYAGSVRSVLVPGGRLFLLCWSDRNPFGRGPERISRGAIRRAFRSGWVVEGITPEQLETRLPEGRVHAWLARLRRT